MRYELMVCRQADAVPGGRGPGSSTDGMGYVRSHASTVQSEIGARLCSVHSTRSNRVLVTSHPGSSRGVF